ncbi:MAG: hypothetical protein JWR60_3622 [Polaromonas sp.]|nr:hypothetical protein [Polaromonas sp.]
MDPTILAAIIGAVATLATGIILWHLQRPKATTTPAPHAGVVGNETNAGGATTYARRYLEHPSHYRFVKSLPKLKAVVLENAQEGWDTGVTVDMREASYDVIDFLEYVWLRLALFYPQQHWNGQSAADHICDYIQNRFAFHWSKHEPDGPGTGGTIVGVLTGGDVMSDLTNLIADTVSALFVNNDEFDFLAWRAAWEGQVGDA